MSLPTSTSTRPRPPGSAFLRLIAAAGATAVALITAMALVAPATAQTSNDFFVGDLPSQGGPAMVSVSGGSIDDLRSAAQSLGVSVVFTTVNGEFIGFAVDAPDFVNQPFRDAFPDGIPEGTSVLIDVPQGGGNNGQPGGGPAGSEPTTMTADLQTINESAQGDQMATGTATFTIDGDTLTIDIQSSGLAPDMAHAQHIHMSNACPDMSADSNGDGVIDLSEGGPSYGDVMLPLDDNLADTEANNYPMSDGDGNLSYSQTVSIADLQSALGMDDLALDTRSVVQHGVGDGADVPDGVDNATLPVDCGVIMMGTGGDTGTNGGNDGTGTSSYTAELQTINESAQGDQTAAGTATFTIDGDMLTIDVQSSGLAPDMAHAQHIHMSNACPGADADSNGDGVVDLSEGGPSYGDVMLPLDDNLADTEANNYPMSDSDGNLSYSQTVSIADLQSALGMDDLALDTRSVVQHGVGDGADVPDGVDNATLPVDCGVIMMGTGGDTGTTGGTSDGAGSATP